MQDQNLMVDNYIKKTFTTINIDYLVCNGHHIISSIKQVLTWMTFKLSVVIAHREIKKNVTKNTTINKNCKDIKISTILINSCWISNIAKIKKIV